MGLIPHAETESMARDAIVLDLGDLRAQARQILENAESEARRIREEAEREYERRVASGHTDGRDAGYQEGFAQGRAAGEESGRAEAREEHSDRLAALCDAFESMLQALQDQRDRMLEEAREDILDFAITFAERVTRRCVEADRDMAVEQAGAALNHVLKPSAIVIAVNPADKEALEEATPSLLSRFGEPPQARLETNESIGRGSAVVRTDRGVVEAIIDDQIARLVAAVRPASTPASDDEL